MLKKEDGGSFDKIHSETAVKIDIFSLMREIYGELRTITKLRQFGMLASTYRLTPKQSPKLLIHPTEKRQFDCAVCVVEEFNLEAQCKCKVK